MIRARRSAALVALAVMSGCSSQPEQLVLTVSGEAPGAVTLLVRLVDAMGATRDVRTAGDADHPVTLPATIYLQLTHTDRVGAVVWVADGGGTIVARAMTTGCVPASSGHYDLTLAPVPDDWTPTAIDTCRCQNDQLICAAGAADAGQIADAALDDGAVEADAGADAAPETDATVDGGADVPADVAVSPDVDAADVPRDAARDLPVDAARADAGAKRDATARMPDAAGPPPATVKVPNTLFGFENAAPDWTSTDTTLARDTKVKSEGTASLSFTIPAAGATSFKSRNFATNDLAIGGDTRLSVDVFAATKQTGDNNTEMWVDCESAGVFGVYVGYKALAPLKAGAWTPLVFTLPDGVRAAFAGKFSDCNISFHVVGTGLVRYDRMGFVP